MKDFIIIGAGQSGLSIAYYLTQQKKDFVILDANEEVGAPWLKRWDSLKLFTPSEFNHLPGMSFPHKKGHYANKYEVADYLKSYVSKFKIPVNFNQKIIALKKEGDHFILKSKDQTFKTKNVVVSTGPFHTPYTPSCHEKISGSVYQIHSEHYKNPNQLQKGDTLVVGAGDSGVQILKEISETNRTVYFSGTTNIATLPQEILGKTLWWWFKKIGFLSANKHSFIGKKIRTGRQPVIGTNVKKLLNKQNVVCVGRTLNANENELVFENKTTSSIKNIIWATGFKPNFNWIENEQLDSNNYPKNYRGVSNTKGLYYLGLPWLHTRGSATLGGVKKDAKYLSNYIKKQAI
ncbi:NAD(P)/FAD-dependent oxidoreductase [uncultured Lacinutrix sp.]|uniref:flavin-containing monooxygenase n=1 Tax=uncultured Lacinutrix sp. TaxID=574032 RepID=UPI002607FA4F|nr:NAD(P)/FAD-dependent oxidoreductase [uncultured Lacinutrix sp.]